VAIIAHVSTLLNAYVYIRLTMSTLTCGLRWRLGVRVVDMSATDRVDRGLRTR